jgi:hypothetical protein
MHDTGPQPMGDGFFRYPLVVVCATQCPVKIHLAILTVYMEEGERQDMKNYIISCQTAHNEDFPG